MKDKQAKYPQLRFKGFTDPWEQRSFKALYKKVIEKNDLSFESDRIISVANMYYKPNDSKSDEKYMETYNIFRLGDIAFEGHKSKNFAYGRFVENTIGDGIVSHVFDVFRPISEYDLNYWKYFIHYEDIMGQKLRMSTTKATMMNNLVSKDFLKQSVLVPNLDEQQKIGTFFKQLDHLITLHQRKLAKLKELKQGYLQKLFPKNGSKFPQLRFAGFADAWEERKLSDLAERVTRKNKNNESNRPLTISAQDGLVDQNDFFDKQIASRDVSGYFLVNNGEFAYNKSYSNGYPWGAIKRLDKYDMGVLSTLYIIFRPTNVSSQFLVAYYDTTRWYKEVSKNAAEGARNHGLLNIAPTDFFSTALVIPNSIEEQQKIGSFFKQLDDTIALHQRKLDLLKEQKKGFLQKMFV